MSKAKEKQQPQEWMYEIVRSPRVTEKTTLGAEHNQITFVVSNEATKPRIKKAVEVLFGVSVKSVNTLNQKGKTKRFRGVSGSQAGFKKAIVTLAEGDFIDTEAGI